MSGTVQFRALLHAQWSDQRVVITMFTLFAAAVTPLSLWLRPEDPVITAMLLRGWSEGIGFICAALAAFVGPVLALRPYALDARTNHTYAMSLPVSRAAYALQRAAAGAVLTLVPALGLFIGFVVASMAVPSTTMIHAYPAGLAARFALASLLTYALAFAAQYGMGRRALRWTVIAALAFLATELVGQLIAGVSVTAPFWELITAPPSPISIFVTRWMLFDV